MTVRITLPKSTLSVYFMTLAFGRKKMGKLGREIFHIFLVVVLCGQSAANAQLSFLCRGD